MNYGELKTAITDYVEGVDEATFVSHLPDFIRLAEEEIYRQVSLQECELLATATTTVDDPMLTKPGDFLYSRTMGIMSGGVFYPLEHKEFSFLREVYGDASETGRPRFYAELDSSRFYLAPVPDAEYETELYYYQREVSITTLDDDDSTWLSLNGENALLFGSLIHAYIYLKGDQDVIKGYTEKFASAVADLKIIAEGRNKKDTYRTPDKRLPV